MPIGNTFVYNPGDLIVHTVSGSGTTFQETKIAAATSSIILFNASASLTSQSLNSLTVGTASYISSIAGTLNTMSKFTGTNSLGNSLIYDDGATVTINTLGKLILSSSAGMFYGVTNYQEPTLYRASTRTLDILGGITAGDVFYNYNSSSGVKYLMNGSGSYGAIFASGSNIWSLGYIGQPAYVNPASSSFWNYALTWNNNGNVGIGTQFPVNKLDVVGNISCSVITASTFFGTTVSSSAVYGNNLPQTFNNIASLRSSKIYATSQSLYVAGYYNAGDGGDGFYYSDPADTTSQDNGGTVITSSNGVRIKPIWTNNLINVKRFGAYGDGVNNDTNAILNAVAVQQQNPTSSLVRQGTIVYFPTGVYNITASITGGFASGRNIPLVMIGENSTNPTIPGDNINFIGSSVSFNYSSTISCTGTNIPIISLYGNNNIVENLSIHYNTRQTGSNASCILLNGAAWTRLNNLTLRNGSYGINGGSSTISQLYTSYIWINQYTNTAIYIPYGGTTNVFEQTYIQNTADELTTPSYGTYPAYSASISGSTVSVYISGSNLFPSYVQPNYALSFNNFTGNTGGVSYNSTFWITSITSLSPTSSVVTYTYSNNTGQPSIPSNPPTASVNYSNISLGSNAQVPHISSSGPAIYLSYGGDYTFIGLDVEQSVTNSPYYIYTNGSNVNMNDLHLEQLYSTVNNSAAIKNDYNLNIQNIDYINAGIFSGYSGSVFDNSTIVSGGSTKCDIFHIRDFADSGSYFQFSSGSIPVINQSIHNYGTLRAVPTTINNTGYIKTGNDIIYSTIVNSGSTVILSQNTGSYNSAFYQYSCISGSNMRAGNINAIFLNGIVDYNETTTVDIGTLPLTMSVTLNGGSNIQLVATASSNNYTIKTISKYI
jgi:Pectate lyase superfamily protein